MLPIISVIIPCYNSGKYLADAIASVRACPDSDGFEIIIVNDGSDDSATLGLLNQLKAEGCVVIHQDNKGPAAARNAGVNVATSEYLLLLDADNKIRQGYILKGVKLLSLNSDMDIFYGKPAFFGDTTEHRFITGPFDIDKILAQNYIDTCVIMRKSAWLALQGQDEAREIIGHEDWEFWLRAYQSGYHFYYCDEILFDYRISSSSLVKPSMAPGGNKRVLTYVYGKHAGLVNHRFKKLLIMADIYQDDKRKPLRSFFKFAYHKFLRK